MKRLFVLLTLMACTAGIVRADGTPVNSKGTLGWLYSFDGLSTFGLGGLFEVTWPTEGPIGQTGGAPSSSGAPSTQVVPSTGVGVHAVGARYFLSDMMALRAGLGIGMSSQSTVGGNPDHTASQTLIGLQAIAEWHMAGIGGVTPYWGAGVGFISASSTDKANANATESKTSASSIDLLGAIGFQWFVANRVSLGGEYRLGVGIVSGSSTSGSTTTDGTSSTTIGTSAWSVILSLYP